MNAVKISLMISALFGFVREGGKPFFYNSILSRPDQKTLKRVKTLKTYYVFYLNFE